MTTKLLAFDLDDTLAASKTPLAQDMAEVLCRLLEKYYIAVISGASFAQMKDQFASVLIQTCANKDVLEKLILSPCNGSALYVWNPSASDFVKLYDENLTPTEKSRIVSALSNTMNKAGIDQPEKIFGEQIEDRDGQVTFSALGQQAPLELKRAWDPDRTKRKLMKANLELELPDFEVRIGGTTSIDITRKGVDKAYAINKLTQTSKYSIPGANPRNGEPTLPDFTREDILFFGDSMEPTGNDYPVKALGVESVTVSGPGDTLHKLKTLAGI